VLPPRFRRPRFVMLAILAIVALTAIPTSIYYFKRAPQPAPLALSEFLQQVDRGEIAKVTFGERDIQITSRDGRTMQTVAPA
jgi:hypothetical protein